MYSTNQSWFGEDHSVRLSKKIASKIAGKLALPAAGMEITIARRTSSFGLSDNQLVIQNISGNYYLSCSSFSIQYWQEVFGVNVGGLKCI